MYCIYLIKFKSLITIAFMEGFQKKFELTPFRMWLLELTLFKTTALPLALFHFFYWLLYELGCVNLTVQYPKIFKSCLNSGSLTCQLVEISARFVTSVSDQMQIDQFCCLFLKLGLLWNTPSSK